MTNIPTDLLRTLVAVVDLHSFTKAANTLGLTQPAVSAQIKRLQYLLGSDVLDRSAQGVRLTPRGELVVNSARRLLSINDQIVQIGGKAQVDQTVRIGMSSDFMAGIIPAALARFRRRWPDVRFVLDADRHGALLRDLRAGNYDLAVCLSTEPHSDARLHWNEEVVWVRGPATVLQPDRPVPLVSFGDACGYHRIAVEALDAAGLRCEDIFVGPSIASLTSAVAAGLGVLPITRRIAVARSLTIWQDPPLPTLPDLHGGIYVREGGAHSAYEQLADEIAAELRTAAPKFTAIEKAPAA